MRKLIALILVMAIFFSFMGCGNSDNVQRPEAAETRVVTDVFNREVEIPHEVKSIICLGSMGPRFAAYLDVVDMMIGAEDMDIERMSARFDYSPVYHEHLKTLPSVGAGGGSGGNNAYAEEIIQIQPDVILAGFDPAAADELQQQTGIPVVSIRYRNREFIDEGFYRSMRVFADVVGAQERCEEVFAYIDACRKDLNDRTKDIPDKEKLKAYTGAVTQSGAHGFYFSYVNFPPFLAVNALNVADEYIEEVTGADAATADKTNTAFLGQNGFDVDPEQIIEWDPDIIFLDPGNMNLVNDEYATNPGYFKSLRAIQNGEVYTMPSTNAAGPNITYLLINAYYAGIVLYPEQFSDIDFRAKSGEIMELMLGIDFFDEMKAAGLYYGKIVIGE
jgi:iron complex transport system substrate-binding protein